MRNHPRDPTTPDTQPPLPEPAAWHCYWRGDNDGPNWDQWHDASDPLPDEWDDDAPDEVTPHYTADQMRAYAAAAVAAERERLRPFKPALDEGPQHPTPAEPAPLWAPEGLVAHDDDPSEDRCLKCCFVDDADSCVQTPCEASAPSGYRPHLSGRPVYFTRKP